MLGVNLTIGAGSLNEDGTFSDDISIEEGYESTSPLFATGSDDDTDFDSLVDFDLTEDVNEITDSEDVALDTLDFRDEINKDAWSTIEYPSLFITGLESEEEFQFFRDRDCGDESESLPMYCVIEGTPIKVCQIKMCLQTFLDFHIIGEYGIELYSNKEKHVSIPVTDPVALVKFIKL